MTVDVGRQLGPYRILSPVGAGGMGQVFLAEHLETESRFALKVLPEELATDKSFAKRFTTLAPRIAELRHPSIVPLRDFGQDDATYYLAFDYISGPHAQPQTVDDCLALRPGGVALQRVVRVWAEQILAALACAHERRIYHHALKPRSLLLDAGGNLKLADFGVAPLIGPEFLLTRIQNAGAHVPDDAAARLRESAEYIAPEQRGPTAASADHRADLYAFGVVLYRILTGRTPVASATPPSKIAPGIDPRWDHIVTTCMQSRPRDRFRSAQAILDALRKAGAKKQQSGLARRPAAASRAPGQAVAATPRVTRSRAGLALSLVALAVMAAAVWQIVSPSGPAYSPTRADVPTSEPTPAPRAVVQSSSKTGDELRSEPSVVAAIRDDVNKHDYRAAVAQLERLHAVWIQKPPRDPDRLLSAVEGLCRENPQLARQSPNQVEEILRQLRERVAQAHAWDAVQSECRADGAPLEPRIEKLQSFVRQSQSSPYITQAEDLLRRLRATADTHARRAATGQERAEK